MEAAITTYVAVPAVSGFFNVLFDRLATDEFMNFITGDDRLSCGIQALKSGMRMVNAVLMDAQQKKLHNKDVKEWFDNVEEAAYDAENLLDEIHAEVEKNKAGGSRGWVEKLRSFFTSSNLMTNDLAFRIDEVNKRFQLLKDEIKVLRLVEKTTPPPLMGESGSYMDEDNALGLGSKKQDVIRFLLREDEEGL